MATFSQSNLPARQSLQCPACGVATLHRFCFHKSGCDVFTCLSCGLGRAETTDFDPAAYYSDAYFEGGHTDGYADYAGSEAVLRREFKATVDVLAGFVPSGRLLEIGCAYGFFLLEAQKRYDVVGIELAEHAVRYCHSRGLAGVRHGLFDEDSARDLPTMDVVVLLDVIEHLAEPDEAFRLIATKLNPGGVVLLTTGDWNSVVARVAGPRWRLMTPPQHLFYFTPNSLHALGLRHGLTIEQISHPWKTVPLSLMLYQLQRVLGMRPRAASTSRALSGTGIPVNLFDAMRVVYRKA